MERKQDAYFIETGPLPVQKNETAAKTGTHKQTAIKALQCMFPSVESFSDFKDNDREISRRSISALIRYAYTHAVIDKESEKAFIDFLRQESPTDIRRRVPDCRTFSNVLSAVSENTSVNQLIAQLDKAARSLGLPSASAAMVTRLKQHFIVNTPRKRAFLRLLAFWIAENRPAINLHYDDLLQMQAKTANQDGQSQEKAGVTISFHLHGQGAMISPPDIAWLKNELADCLDYLKLTGQISKKMIETIGTTSFAIRFFKQPGPPDEPLLYRQGIHHALTVAHQMSVRWLLCSHSSPRKRLIVMINAGTMWEDRRYDLYLQENIPAKDTGIYLNSLAHLCAEISNIKGFRRCHRRSAASGDLWSLVYFWPNHFYDYIPCLLEEEMLPKFSAGRAYEEFRRALLFPELNAPAGFGAIEAMHRHPQHTLHFIEIAKVLRARQMHHESEEVTSRVLLAEPENLPARYMRLLAHGHLANREQGIQASLLSFERGMAEGNHILKTFHPDTEILWAMGILNFNRAIKLLHCLWRGHTSSAEPVGPEDILDYLKKSADYFHQGLATSSAGQSDSCLFWLQYALCFSELFSGTEKNIFNRRISPEDDKNIFRQAGIRSWRILGLLPDHPFLNTDKQKMDEVLSMQAASFIFSKNQNAMLGRSYLPYAQYTFAIALWDFAPRLTAPVCGLVRYLLDQARRSAERLLQDNISVYHVFSGFMFPDRFIHHIDQSIRIIKTFISDDDLARGNDFPIHPSKERKMARTKLMLVEVDRL